MTDMLKAALIIAKLLAVVVVLMLILPLIVGVTSLAITAIR